VFESLESSLGSPLEAALPALAEHEENKSLFERQQATGPQYYTVRRSTIQLEDNVIGQAIVLSDVTELEVQRRRLKQQTEHMEGVTAEIAHQLRNPLTILKGELELIRDSSGSGPLTEGGTPDDSVGTAVEATERIERIADDLISFINYGKPISGTEPLALTELLTKTFEEARGTHMELQMQTGDSATIVAERTRCSELFRLLFRVHRQRGATAVSVRSAGSHLTISSDGTPFETDTPEKLFEYGVETDEDMRILLAHVRTLTQIHGWSIYATGDQSNASIVIDGISFVTDEE
jgi:signal transduction histidine kinase